MVSVSHPICFADTNLTLWKLPESTNIIDIDDCNRNETKQSKINSQVDLWRKKRQKKTYAAMEHIDSVDINIKMNVYFYYHLILTRL